MAHRTRSLLFGLLFIAAGCADEGGPTDPPPLAPPASPELTISDGTSATGNPHFFWLPPLASNPNATGEVNQGLLSAVVVRVCYVAEDPCRSAALDGPNRSNLSLAEFTDESGTGGALLGLGTDSYQVDWKTSETETGSSLSGEAVRVWVLLGKAPLEDQIPIGSIDVSFAEDGSQARGRSGDALREGRTLPLRFRMEQGVGLAGDCLDDDGLDCVKFVGSDDGFEECTEESGACLEAEPGWLPEGFEGGAVLIQVKQEPLVDGACFEGLSLPQREACYRITTFPDLGGAAFQADVFFSMCQEANVPANYEIHQRTGSGEVRRPVGLAGPVPELDCSAFALASMTPLSRFAVRVGEFVFGRPLHASDGLTARLSSFSEFFWAPAAEFASVTAPPTADPEEIVSIQLQLGLDHGATGDLAGIAVEIEVDGGSLAQGPYVSDVNGVVSTDWTLPSVPDIYTLEATIPVLVESLGMERSTSLQVEVVAVGSPTTGDVFGFVSDGNQNPIASAGVTTPGLNPVLSTTTDATGNYLIPNVPAGTQAIQVDITGFRSVIAYTDVTAGQSVAQNFTLPASTAPFVLDQVHDPATGTTASCVPASDFQSFTPGGSPLGRVELRARANGGFPGTGTMTTVHIRDGSPTGPILVSATTLIQAAGGADVWVDFEFTPALVTEAGQVLVIEWNMTGSEVSWYQEDPGTYAGGIGFDCFGNPNPRDRSFRTSSFAVPS